MARAAEKVVPISRSAHEEYVFPKEAIVVGGLLHFASTSILRGGHLLAPQAWRIVATQARNVRGDVVDARDRRKVLVDQHGKYLREGDPRFARALKEAGALEHWCDALVLEDHYSTRKTIRAGYIRDNVRWRLVVGG